MITERIQLMPGVCLNYVQTERFKTGCFSFNLLCPLTLEDAAPNALIPAVLLRGCKECPDMQAISQRLDVLYGASVGTLIRKKGEIQSVGLYADFLEDRYADGESVFDQMMALIRSLLFEPCLEQGGFLESFVEGERLNLRNTIAARVNEKRAYAVNRLLHHMCNGEAYAVPRLGEAHTLDDVTPQNLLLRWRKLLRHAPIEIFYLGQQPRNIVLKAMERLLEGLQGRGRTSLETDDFHAMRPVRYVQENMEVTQGKLTIGLRTDITASDARYPAMMLMNTIFGAGMTSKLFVKIREEQALCYYVSSSMDKFKGIMVIGSGIEFDKYQVSLDGILHQLDLCKQGEISKEELESAREYLISALRTGNDSPGRLDDFAIGQAITGMDGSMEQLAEEISSLTLEQVVDAAKTLRLDTVYFLKGVEA